MTLKSDAKFEETVSLDSKNEMRNLANFDPSTRGSQNLLFTGFLLTKLNNV